MTAVSEGRRTGLGFVHRMVEANGYRILAAVVRRRAVEKGHHRVLQGEHRMEAPHTVAVTELHRRVVVMEMCRKVVVHSTHRLVVKVDHPILAAVERHIVDVAAVRRTVAVEGMRRTGSASCQTSWPLYKMMIRASAMYGKNLSQLT